MQTIQQVKEAPKKEICLVCNKTVYFNEKVSVDSVSYHADCFRCYKCRTKINPLSYGKVEGFFFCKTHFEQKKKETLIKIQYSGQSAFALEKKGSTTDFKQRKPDKVNKGSETPNEIPKETPKPDPDEQHEEKTETPREDKQETPRNDVEKQETPRNETPREKTPRNDVEKQETPREKTPITEEVIPKEEVEHKVETLPKEEEKIEQIVEKQEDKEDQEPNDHLEEKEIHLEEIHEKEEHEEHEDEIVIDHYQHYKETVTPLVDKDVIFDKTDEIEDKIEEKIEEKVPDHIEEKVEEKVEVHIEDKVEEKIEKVIEQVVEESKPIPKEEPSPIIEENKPQEIKKEIGYDDLINELFKHDFEPLFLILKSEKEKDGLIEGIISYLLKENKEKELLRILEKSVHYEVASTLEYGTLFRANSFASKLMKFYSSRVSAPIYEKIISPFIEKLISNSKDFEVDPKKAEGQDTIKNSQNVENVIQEWLDDIMNLPQYLPYTFRCYCKYLYDTVGEKFKSTEESGYEVKHLAIGGFIFLRLISPTLINPEAFKMKFSQALNNDTKRYLVIITKIIQNLANGVTVANKEEFMDYFTTLIKKNIPKISKLFDEISTIPENRIEAIDQTPINDLIEQYYNIHRSVISQLEANKTQFMELKEKDVNSFDEIQNILSHLKRPPEKERKQSIIVQKKPSEGPKKEFDVYQKLDSTNEFFDDFGHQRNKVEEKQAEKDKKSKEKVEEKVEKHEEKELIKKKSTFSLGGLIKGVVSKNKKRFQEDGFDLDMSYITNQIIAMGYPSQGFQALVRNNMQDVIDYMEKKHKDQYMVYNLCAEKFYDSESFKGRVDNFGFEDHNPPPLMIMRPLCTNIHNWLSSGKERVAAIHCKAGKGRTGTIIASYLLHSGQCKTAEEALKLFGDMRTKDGKGVTISSQKRYVKYYEICLKKGFPKRDVPLTITEIKWNQCPHFGVTPNVKIQILGKEIFNMKQKTELSHFEPKEEQVPITFKMKVPVKGDFKVIFTDKDEKYFHFWLNTNMIEGNKVLLKRDEIDSKGVKKLKFKRFQSDFAIVIKFERE